MAPKRNNAILIPAFLCPGWVQSLRSRCKTQRRWALCTTHRHLTVATKCSNSRDLTPPLTPATPPILLGLPIQCPGCGAYSQCSTPEQAGYYAIQQKRIRNFLSRSQKAADGIAKVEEAVAFAEVVENAEPIVLEELGINDRSSAVRSVGDDAEPPMPVCDRLPTLYDPPTAATPLFDTTEIHEPSVWRQQQLSWWESGDDLYNHPL